MAKLQTTLQLTITALGRLVSRSEAAQTAPGEEPMAAGGKTAALQAAFDESPSHGLLYLATSALQTSFGPSFDFARQFGTAYLTKFCHRPNDDGTALKTPVLPPSPAELATLILQAPPMLGQEYLTPELMAGWWHDLDALVRAEAARHPGGPQAYLAEKSPLWRTMGRVTFHLAENKRDPDSPFAFMATYSRQLSAQGKVLHEPLGRALQHYAGDKNREALLTLLGPMQRATEKSPLAKELVDSGDVFHPLAWTPHQAHRFLQEIPALEASGLIVRVPDWWKATRPPRPVVSVQVGGVRNSVLGADALLDFQVGVALDGEELSEEELELALESVGGLVRLKGKWVEVDREKLAAALEHWKEVERRTRDGLSFFEGMRLLSGAPLERDTAGALTAETREWTGLSAGPFLEQTLQRLRAPEATSGEKATGPAGLKAELRPYQRVGMDWLRFLTELGLGALLADDMGLGKTIQVIALFLKLRESRTGKTEKKREPHLLVVPASLVGNWKAELQRFAPTLSSVIVHPSEMPDMEHGADLTQADVVITTYGMLQRLQWLRERHWDLVILDEAQAIKNSGTRQSKAVKELRSAGRIALTGTPVENRLSDLWSLFDFLNPGLLGSAKTFANLVKQLSSDRGSSYQPLRTLIQPYILRRLKTDTRIISDLPQKTEVRAYSGLSRQQAALYEQAVRELSKRIAATDGIQRKGLVLAQLMRLKQICNHPAQWLGNGDYDPQHSGKFQRLAELCDEMAERQERVLVFTQFRELTEPLANHLAKVFRRPGLILHGGTPVKARRELVQQFQQDNGPPFFVLSLKAGGTGLNLTAASQVVHFDRWWNPAVENQATDRAFRIGQKRNVLVHKFVCRGTLEERIDELMTEKSAVAGAVLEGGEALLTEMDDAELLEFVKLDLQKAVEA